MLYVLYLEPRRVAVRRKVLQMNDGLGMEVDNEVVFEAARR